MTDDAAGQGPVLSEGLGPLVTKCADCRTPNSCTPDGACLEGYIGMRLNSIKEDNNELLAHLSALVDRCAFDGVPNDSLPVWQAAHDAVMRRKRA